MPPFEYLFNAKAAANDPTSYQALEARRKIALQMLANSGRKGYPKTFGEGLTAIGDAIGDVGQMNQLAQMEATWGKQAAARAAAATGDDSTPPSTPPPTVPQTTSENTAADKPIVASSYAPEDTGDMPAVRMVNTAATPAVATAAPAEVEPGVTGPGYNPLDAAGAADPWAARRNAIAGIETGGEKDPYTSLGKVIPSTGDRAHGKYQIMGANIPSWTQAALGQALTPQQFLASPAAQEATFQHRFGNYVDKYGDEGAARAWYAGEHGMNKLNATDVHERLSVADYGRDFMNRMAPYNRDRVAASITPPAEQPSAALPLTASDATSSDLPPEITQGFSARPQAAAAAGQIRTAPPPQVVAQMTAPPDPRTAPPPNARLAEPPYPQMPLKNALRIANERALIKAQMLGDPNADAYKSAIAADELNRKQIYDNQVARYEQLRDLPKRQEEMIKARTESDIAARFGGPTVHAKLMEDTSKNSGVANASANALTNVYQAQKALDHAIVGYGANSRISFIKALDYLGYHGQTNEAAASEIFKSLMASNVGATIKETVGSTGISNADRQYGERAAGGDITMTREALNKLLDISRRHHIANINQHTEKLENTFNDPVRDRAVRSAYNVEMTYFPGAVERLKTNPHEAAQFDAIYGKGRAKRILETP